MLLNVRRTPNFQFNASPMSESGLVHFLVGKMLSSSSQRIEHVGLWTLRREWGTEALWPLLEDRGRTGGGRSGGGCMGGEWTGMDFEGLVKIDSASVGRSSVLTWFSVVSKWDSMSDEM